MKIRVLAFTRLVISNYFLFLIFLSQVLAQTDLGLGDIAFTQYASTSPDSFSFVLLKDVETNTEISFTDNGWLALGGFRSGETTCTWRSDQAVSCGTVIKIISSPFSANIGSVTGSALNLSESGDQIFAYQGNVPTASNQHSFLAAIHMNGEWESDASSTNTSAIPSVFTDGENALSIFPERNNAHYDCSTSISSADILRTEIFETSNWISDNNVLQVSPCSFSCTQSCSIDAATLLSQTACNPFTDTYSADISLSFTGIRSPATVSINGQSFVWESSTQTFTLNNLAANGLPVDLSVSISGSSSCFQNFTRIFSAPSSCAPTPSLVINEIDYDQPGSDTTEFIEIKNTGIISVNLQNAELRLINGSGSSPSVYNTINLSGLLLPGDYFVVCKTSSNVPNCDLEGFSSLQNGGTSPDAIALYVNGNLMDMVSYDGSVPGFVEGSGEGLIDENDIIGAGLSRLPDGFDTGQNNQDFTLICISPGEANLANNTGCLPCKVSAATLGDQSPCDPSTNQFSQELILEYDQAPQAGSISVNGQLFPITGSPQTLTLTLAATGDSIDLEILFTEEPSCSFEKEKAFLAPKSCAPVPQLVINEIDYDQPGPDSTEFIELKNVGTFPAFLDKVAVHLINGASDTPSVYRIIPLSGVLAAEDYLVICKTGSSVPNCDLEGFTSIQNGGTTPDAIALFYGDSLLDVVSYNGSVAGFVEGSGEALMDDGDIENTGISRLLDGEDSGQNNLDFVPLCISPGEANLPSNTACLPCSISGISLGNTSDCKSNNNTFSQELTIFYTQAPSSGKLSINGRTFDITGSPQSLVMNQLMADGKKLDIEILFTADSTCIFEVDEAIQAPEPCAPPPNLIINEIDYDQVGTDTKDFVELKNVSDKPAVLTGLEVLFINGTDAEPYKTYTFPKGTLPPWGYCVLCFDPSVENCDILLTGSIQNGPDAVALKYNEEILDAVSYEGAVPGFSEGDIGAGTDDGSLTEQSLSRQPNGKDTDKNYEDFQLICATPGRDNDPSLTYCLPCEIRGIQGISQTTCDPETGLFDQIIRIDHFNAPDSGKLVVNGLAYNILSPPQDIYLINLPSNSAFGDIEAFFDAETQCALSKDSVFQAPDDCRGPCKIQNVELLDQGPCDSLNNSFSQDIRIHFENAPFDGSLIVNGVAFDTIISPFFLSLENLPANGSAQSLSIQYPDSSCSLFLDSAFTAPPACVDLPKLVLNEVDYDQLGADSLEFIEIKNIDDKTISLEAMEIVLVNGSTGLSYQSVPLKETDLPAGEYFVLCFGDSTEYCDQVVSGSIQNGAPDGIVLSYRGVEIDALAYEGEIPGLNEGSVIDLFDAGDREMAGLSRFPDGKDSDQNNEDFILLCNSPGKSNETATIDCLNCMEKGISKAQISEISECDSLEEFSLKLSIHFSPLAKGDSVFVLSQPFALDQSPQILTLTGLPANGQLLNIQIALASDTSCIFELDSTVQSPFCELVPIELPKLVINEVDYDQVGADEAEFIELKNVGIDTILLEGTFVELINGSDGSIYQNISLLPILLHPNTYYVLCSDIASVPNCNQSGLNSLQNGAPDGIRLVFQDSVLDVLSYEGDLSLLPDAPGIALLDPGIENHKGLSRFPDGMDTDDNDQDFQLICTTPGAPNADCPSCVEASAIRIGEQTTCDPATDSYDQLLEIDFTEMNVSEFILNGKSYSVESDRQAIWLTGLPADGQPVDVSFSNPNDSTCFLNIPAAFVGPPSCAFDLFGTSDLKINELNFPNDSSGLGAFIELKNTGAKAVQLSDFQLSLKGINTNIVHDIAFPSQNLLPDQFMLFCEDNATDSSCISIDPVSINTNQAFTLFLYQNQVLVDSLRIDQKDNDPYTGFSLVEGSSYEETCLTPGKENSADQENCAPCSNRSKEIVEVQRCISESSISLISTLEKYPETGGIWTNIQGSRIQPEIKNLQPGNNIYLFLTDSTSCGYDTTEIHIQILPKIEAEIVDVDPCRNFPRLTVDNQNLSVSFIITSNGQNNGAAGPGIDPAISPKLSESGSIRFEVTHKIYQSEDVCANQIFDIPFSCEEPKLVINEFEHLPHDASETAFIELKHVGEEVLDSKNMELLLVRKENGTNKVYHRVSLNDVQIEKDGYWVLCLGENGKNCDLSLPGVSLERSGAIALSYAGQVFEAVSYSEAHGEYTEGKTLPGPNSVIQRIHSFARQPDGWDSQNNAIDFVSYCATPGYSNDQAGCEAAHTDLLFEVEEPIFSTHVGSKLEASLTEFISYQGYSNLTYKVLQAPFQADFVFNKQGEFQFQTNTASPKTQTFLFEVCEENAPFRCRRATSLVHIFPSLSQIFTWGKIDAWRNSNQNTTLTWETKKEEGNQGFHVERSSEGTMFIDLGFVESEGNVPQGTSYQFTDKQSLQTVAFYRIKQVFVDGSHSYSEVMKVSPDRRERLSIFPNPTHTSLTVVLFADAKGVSELHVIDMQGNIQLKEWVKLEAGKNTVNLDLGDLLDGNYIVRIMIGGEVFQKKLVKSP